MAYDPTAIPKDYHKAAIQRAVSMTRESANKRLKLLMPLSFLVGFILGTMIL
jgi:hypothetical protein